MNPAVFAESAMGNRQNAAPAKYSDGEVNRNEQTMIDGKKDLRNQSDRRTDIALMPEQINAKVKRHYDSENVTVVVFADLNWDGTKDAIVQGPPDWCGATGLCDHVAVMSAGTDFRLVDLGTFFSVEYEPGTKKLFVAAHGTECNLPGNRPCQYEIHWDGSTFRRK